MATRCELQGIWDHSVTPQMVIRYKENTLDLSLSRLPMARQHILPATKVRYGDTGKGFDY